MTKLNQIIAIEKGIKSGTYAGMSDLNKAVQKAELFNGFQKSYRKIDEADPDLPPESKRVQFTSKTVLENVERGLTELMQVVARKDWTNCVATGSVVVDGKTIVPNAPVSYLLFSGEAADRCAHVGGKSADAGHCRGLEEGRELGSVQDRGDFAAPYQEGAEAAGALPGNGQAPGSDANGDRGHHCWLLGYHQDQWRYPGPREGGYPEPRRDFAAGRQAGPRECEHG